jgi:general secretion pathway protein C
VAQGFKLFGVRPDSVYAQMGLQNGDTIRRVNGQALTSPEKVLELYSKVKDASRIEIEFDRRGSSVKKTYTVR